MTETTQKETMPTERMERRLAQAELKFERRFAQLQAVYDSRIDLLEDHILSIHRMLNDFRNAFDEDLESLIEAHKKINSIQGDLDEIDDRLTPVFERHFPDHGKFLNAFVNIIYKPGSKRG